MKVQTKEKTGQIQRFGNGQIIFKEGSPGKAMHLIKAGQVKLTRESKKGQKKVTVILGVLSKNDYFGEMAIFDYGSRSATATAVGEVITKLITDRDLQTMIEESPMLAWLFLKKMSERIRMTDNKIESLLVKEKLGRSIYEKLDKIRYPEYLKQIT